MVAVCLSGCSGVAAEATLGSTNGEAVAIGQQAVGFTASGSSSADWTSPIACPASFEDGLRSSTPSGDSIQSVDPKTVTGPVSDPQLTKGYVATCVDRITSPTKSLVELTFFDIDESHSDAIVTRLSNDGFVSHGTTQNTDAQGHPYAETIYSSDQSAVVVETVTINSTPALIVVG